MKKTSFENSLHPTVSIRGADVYKGALNRAAQEELLALVRKIVQAAPLYQPVMPSGRKMSVRMSAAGEFGWVSDAKGYRYASVHPLGMPWPAIPELILRLWDQVSGCSRHPECCLINFYSPDARMGMHQDNDERDFTAPVVSISLGDDGLFRVGNTTRGGKTESLWLRSGDIVVLGGEARLAHHGIDRIRAGSSDLLQNGGRLNLTLRVVT
ncbi:MAG: alpha-ketoglutarate-dependent dioxygenase AlkB [Dinoroseobacter sp.]|nr:alpha-ketoglutarate-dependent dioxygenase AlkB [Dinoroseobacter sp.]